MAGVAGESGRVRMATWSKRYRWNFTFRGLQAPIAILRRCGGKLGMPTKKPTPPPQALPYLQTFSNMLAKLQPKDRNEDVDATKLESALRKRVRGLDEQTAQTELARDRELLERWLKTKPDHPAHWIRGFLLSPDLAANFT